MTLILGKSKILKPNKVKEIRPILNIEKNSINMAKSIAKQFGEQSKKMKPKKIIFR